MKALLIKNIPPPLHDRLRQRAAAHHRSMNREVIAILEQELERPKPAEEPPPVVQLDRPVSGEWIVQIIRDGRDTLVTEDKRILRACPDAARSMKQFLSPPKPPKPVREKPTAYKTRRKGKRVERK